MLLGVFTIEVKTPNETKKLWLSKLSSRGKERNDATMGGERGSAGPQPISSPLHCAKLQANRDSSVGE